ncbi:MAG: helix-turn-helix domain-containing protein [Planctomycetes bacterium]|nr:helix-turn-helix domain-containing protein [Planctomycetota bacterium]
MVKKSAKTVELLDMFTKKHFERIDKMFDRNFALGIETAAIDGNEIGSMCSSSCSREFCRIVRSSRTGASRCRQDRLRSLNLAIETGQPYTSLCHAGIVFVCVPIMDQHIPLGGLFFGKCLTDEFSYIAEEDILKRLKGLRLNRTKLIEAARNLPLIPSRRIHDAAEFLFILLYEVTTLDPSTVHWRRQQAQQQSEISEHIQKSKKLGHITQYPYESEQKLIAKVKIGDRTGAKETLNTILGTIMFRNPGDLNVLKARLVELLSVLSRAAAEGGVDINLLLEKNLAYIGKVLNINTQQDLCAWISHGLNDFIESVYTSQDAKKITQLKPAIDYIDANFDRQITLPEIAKQVHLSVSRLAHLFKEQMGITLIDYLTNVRITHAKRLLLTTDDSCTTICYRVGYNNQSYFTRTFKDIAGMTPGQFRQNNKR